MKLTKKHVGKLFDVRGGDGSWAYQLVDIKGKRLLFNVVGDVRRFEIDTNKLEDWRPFVPAPFSKEDIQKAWATARETGVL